MKRALVTGGSGDIGNAICQRLAMAGFHVIVHANKNKTRADELVNELLDEGYSAQATCFDVSSNEVCQQAINEILAEGPVQVLVNNAGIHDDAIMAGMTAQQWHKVVDVNLNGFFNVTQPLLLPMMQTRWGRIINITSIVGTLGNRGQANYSAAKAGLHGATKTLAHELATRKITVNAIAPGIIAGQMADKVFDKKMINEMVPMKRAGTPEEVASLVAFLVSDEAAYISGQIIGINGAMA